MAQYPSAAAGDSNLYIAVNKTSTTLTDNPLAAGAVTVNVLDASAFPSVGAISIDAEIIHYTGKTGTSFTGCTRGFDGTTDVAHTVSTPVYHKVIADHHNVLKEEIKAIESDLIACKAALNDADTPASTSSDVKDRLDQIVSQLKLITGETNWYDAPDSTVAALYSSVNAKLPLAGGTMTGNIAMSGTQKLTGLAAGTTNGDSLRYEQLVGVYLPLAGGTVTGVTAIQYGGIALTIGADLNASTLTNNTEKFARLAAPHYVSSTEEASCIINANNDSTSNTITIGGGTSSLNAATSIRFFAAANNTTVLGTNVGEITFNGCKFKGTNTNDDAAAGLIGEYVYSTFSSVLDGGSGVYESFASVSLTAGDWDVSAICELRANTSGSGTALTQEDLNELLINTTVDSSSNPIGQRHQFRWWSSVNYNNQIFDTMELTPQRISIASTTTVYITGMYTFGSTGRITTSGRIRARRVR